MKEGKVMKKIYVSPKAEVVCYSTPDITSINIISSVDITSGGGSGTGVPSVVNFNSLHK